MKIDETPVQPDGMLLTISGIFVETYEERDEVIKEVKKVLRRQKRRCQKEIRDMLKNKWGTQSD